MLEYELTINERKFSGEIDYEKRRESSIQLEILLKAAPIYYLYKYKDNEFVKSFITPYTALSLITEDAIKDLIDLNNNSDFIINYFYDPKKDKAISTFVKICVQEIIENNSFDGESFLNKIEQLNLNQFNNQRRIYNFINEIIGACYNLRDKKKKTKTFEKYVSDKLLSLLLVVSPKIYNFIKKYQRINYQNNKYYLSCFFSKNNENKKSLSTSITNNINNTLNFLSITPSNNKQYLNKLKSMKTQCIKQLPNYMEKDRCFAIAENKNSIYFSFSGLWDKDGNISNEMNDTAKKINNELFQGNANWCILTNNVLNYVDPDSPHNQNECKYLNIPEHFPGKNESFFSCCERKILGRQTNLKDFNLFVFFSPCYKCAKPLYKNYNSITCLLNFEDSNRQIKYKENVFNPKQYEITFIDKHYKVRKIGK